MAEVFWTTFYAVLGIFGGLAVVFVVALFFLIMFFAIGELSKEKKS